MENTKEESWSEELTVKLDEYFSGLIHYQYDINHELDTGGVKFEKQQLYLRKNFSEWIESLLSKEKSRIREDFVEKEELRRLFTKVKNYPSKLKDITTFLEDIKKILS